MKPKRLNCEVKSSFYRAKTVNSFKQATRAALLCLPLIKNFYKNNSNSPILKDIKSIIINQDKTCRLYASKNLQQAGGVILGNRQFSKEIAVIKAINKNGMLLEYVSQDLQNDWKVVLAAINQNKLALQFATRKAVLNILEKDGMLLEYVSQDLQADKDIVLAAIKQNEMALQYVSPDLQNDWEVVLAAINQNIWVLQFATRKAVLSVLEKDGMLLEYVSQDLRADKDLSLIHI
jgi:hypothetical protein